MNTVQLWQSRQRKFNRKLVMVGVTCAIIGLCASMAHGQSHGSGYGSAGGGGGAIRTAPGFGTGTSGPTQNYISKGLGGATLMNGAGALVCGALSAGWCSLGFGVAGLTTGGLDYFIGYAGLPDGEYVMGGGGGGPCVGCKKASDSPDFGGGGSFAAKLTVSTGNQFAFTRFTTDLPPSHGLRSALRAAVPRPDWRGITVTAIQNNLLAPRFRQMPKEVMSMRRPQQSVAGPQRSVSLSRIK